MYFIGTYLHNLDEKSRLIMPSKLREKLGTTVYITLGLDKCLSVYPEEAYEKKAEKLAQVETNDFKKRQFIRTFFGSSYQCDLDKQGRVQLSKESLNQCQIKKDVVIIGVVDHIEIWDRERYYQMEQENEAAYEENASNLFDSKGE